MATRIWLTAGLPPLLTLCLCLPQALSQQGKRMLWMSIHTALANSDFN